MADISILNIGGSDYNIKDATARTSIDNSLGIVAYKEDGNTASQAYAVIGTPINWKGNLYTLKAAVASGANWVVGTNLTAAPNLGKLTSNIKTYVNGSGELVFRDLTGADTVLPFSGSVGTYEIRVNLSARNATNMYIGTSINIHDTAEDTDITVASASCWNENIETHQSTVFLEIWGTPYTYYAKNISGKTLYKDHDSSKSWSAGITKSCTYPNQTAFDSFNGTYYFDAY